MVPGHASLEGINGTLGQLGHFDARNHLLNSQVRRCRKWVWNGEIWHPFVAYSRWPNLVEPHSDTWFTWPSIWSVGSFRRKPTRKIKRTKFLVATLRSFCDVTFIRKGSKNGVPRQQMICCKWDQTGNAYLTCSKNVENNLSSVEGPLFKIYAMQNIYQILWERRVTIHESNHRKLHKVRPSWCQSNPDTHLGWWWTSK